MIDAFMLHSFMRIGGGWRVAGTVVNGATQQRSRLNRSMALRGCVLALGTVLGGQFYATL